MTNNKQTPKPTTKNNKNRNEKQKTKTKTEPKTQLKKQNHQNKINSGKRSTAPQLTAYWPRAFRFWLAAYILSQAQ